MITEDYVSFETAKLLKEKGFYQDFYNSFIPVWHYNGNNKVLSFTEDDSYPSETQEWYSAPTFQTAMKWLREVHKLCISITPQVTDDDGDGGCLWQFAITSHLEPLSISLELYEQYEEACEAAIKYCLENLI